MTDINDIANKCDLFIDNAATASQTDFDDVTREAIRLNVFAPMLSALIAATPRPAPVAPDIEEAIRQIDNFIAQSERVSGHVNGISGRNLKDWKKALAALSSELAEAKREIERLTKINADHCRTVNAYILDNSRQEDLRIAAEAEVARLKDENGELVAGLQVLATTFYKEDQHQDYAKHVLDRARSLTATKGG